MSAVRERPSPNHDARPEGAVIDMVVLHYTGMQSAAAAIDRLCDPAAKVSSHYVVDEEGLVHRLVAEEQRAWHAGISTWRGREALNAWSVGIEIVNPGHEWGYRPFPAPQVAAVRELCRAILARHPIPPRNVVAHSDIAPDRKQDPGELFPWAELARHGVGLWPACPDGGEAGALRADEELRPVRAALARVGYAVASDGPMDAALRTVLCAFQRHWRPESVNGEADCGTRARLSALLGLMERA